jgi:hypothetical protein
MEPFPDDLEGKELEPICLLGVFNPMGPTLVCLNLVVSEKLRAAALLCTTLNPFSQSQLITGMAPLEAGCIDDLIRSSYLAGDEESDGLILQSRPTVLLMGGRRGDSIREAVLEMLRRLLDSIPDSEPLSETNRRLRDDIGEPWSRIPSFEDMVKGLETETSVESDQVQIPDDDFRAWLEIMLDSSHLGPELNAILTAWAGSIQQIESGLPSVSEDEMLSQLLTLGFNLNEAKG